MVSPLRHLALHLRLIPLDSGISTEHPRQQECLPRVTEAAAEKAWT
jgi:hypothetical protein